MAHTYNEILLGHKKEHNHAICSNMDATRDYHTKRNKSEEDKHHMMSLICGESKMRHRGTNLGNSIRDMESRLVVAMGKE